MAEATLVDFGIAKVYDSQLQTTAGARAVTPGYSPLEQYGQGTTDARTDIYALGATLYHLLTGSKPPESVERVTGDTLEDASQFEPGAVAGRGGRHHGSDADPAREALPERGGVQGSFERPGAGQLHQATDERAAHQHAGGPAANGSGSRGQPPTAQAQRPGEERDHGFGLWSLQ